MPNYSIDYSWDEVISGSLASSPSTGIHLVKLDWGNLFVAFANF